MGQALGSGIGGRSAEVSMGGIAEGGIDICLLRSCAPCSSGCRRLRGHGRYCWDRRRRQHGGISCFGFDIGARPVAWRAAECSRQRLVDADELLQAVYIDELVDVLIRIRIGRGVLIFHFGDQQREKVIGCDFGRRILASAAAGLVVA